MKKVGLSTIFTITVMTRLEGEVTKPVTYYDLIKETLETPPPGGFSLEVMHPRLRILTVLEKAKGKNTVSFEEGDFELIRKLYKDMKFIVVSQGYEDFATHLDEVAKQTEKDK